MRIVFSRRSLLLAGLAIIAGCQRAPFSGDRGRTLEDFEPQLTRRLTPALARAAFGAPDEDTGSGLRIYVYRLRDGDRLWLGFPGDRPIVYAKLQAADGGVRDLPLRP
jgi:hypothetical protein